ncbi:hypothetical protein C474_05965 [Halogeometricum pallidum JCM 14848]|uniref:Yip1 domain-containing protein n=1 Tax=Halogeometricum pallidum JCM 14848 TaxID=1227487 RepID=M0DBB6_HALPD|nr:hypothetical protein C474_05965 [Halogeometricum pallidum JCM 14848]
MPVTITASLLGTVLSFLIVAAATYVTTSVLSDGASVAYSLLTAAITSVVWFGVTYFISGVVGVGGYAVALGPALAVIAYVITVDILYEKGIGQAIAISVGTWTISFIILYVAAYFGYSSFQALGVPPGI